MFSSSPSEKCFASPDGCSQGRNALNRFPVGITPLGDENQQFRIQLAVHKYNSTSNSPLNSRCILRPPVRQSFLKNSLKAKNYEGDTEGTSNAVEKRSGNQYDGVGAFPTIHLKKNAVRYRPIKRFHNVKVHYPELPVNRFLSNLPEVCSDFKSSTRSVLDVLEDLSGNKIHSKDDSKSNKPKSRGLGGDFLLNPNSLYRPLFVQKPKASVLTRDNTTQTLSPVSVGTPSLIGNNSQLKSDSSDPRAELRRKLAKQNNEIFASLSSSISSSFSLKRKLDKVLPTKDDKHLSPETIIKKSKTSDLPDNFKDKVNRKPDSNSKTNSSETVKFNRKSKLNETTSTSPNKDRLTTIFLDMQNTSSKAQMFQNGSLSETTSEDKDKSEFTNISATIGVNESQNKTSLKMSPTENNTAEKINNESVQNCLNYNLGGKSPLPNSEKLQTGHSINMMFNFPNSKPNDPITGISNGILKSNPSSFQLNTNSSTALNFNPPKTSVGIISDHTDTSKNAETKTEKTDEQKKDLSKGLVQGNSFDKANISLFKFGTNGTNSSQPINLPEENKNKSSETVSLDTTPVANLKLQFSFGTSPISSSDTKPSSTISSPVKAFQNQENNKVGEKNETSKSLTTSNVSNIEKVQPGAFIFEQKSNADSSAKTEAFQNGLNPPNQTNQTSNISAANFNTVSAPSKMLFSFGENAKTSTTLTIPSTSTSTNQFSFTFGQKPEVNKQKTQEELIQNTPTLFSFKPNSPGQGSNQSPAPTTVITSSSQPSTSPLSSLFGQNTSATTNPAQLNSRPLPSQVSNNFEIEPGSNSFGAGSNHAMNQNNSAFPVKTISFGSSTNGFGASATQRTTETSTTTSSGSAFAFGGNTTQITTGLVTSASPGSGFGFGASATNKSTPSFVNSPATQSATFVTPSTTQSVPGFGSSSTTQTVSTFGTSSSHTANGFGVAVSTQPVTSFRVSSGTQSASTFGVSSDTQSTTTFGTNSTKSTPSSFEANLAKQSTPVFGVSSTAPSTTSFGAATQSAPVFGTSTTQATPAFVSSTSFGVSNSLSGGVFGTPTSTQSAIRFGAPTVPGTTSFIASTGFSTPPTTNTGFGTPVTATATVTTTSTSGFAASQPSFSQPFANNKPPTSLGQTPGIFGQNTVPAFSSSNTFNSNQSNIFNQKPNSDSNMFGQNKIQTSVFGSTTQTFGAQNKFSFGMSTSSATGFTNTNTTTSGVFNFGGNTTGSAFSFSGNSSESNNSHTPFAFKNSTNEPFKFGASNTATTKEGTGFNGAAPPTFSFGNQMNSNPIPEQKPAFNFGSTQASSSGSGFNFGATSSPSVFSFGSSTSSASSGSTFNFGTSTPGGSFGQTPTPSPGATFSVTGTFNIGSGTTQSRPRALSRPRRRP